ncbi:MAG TPA: hypothetical protein VJS92_09875 [Candidatus Polarisedimenticolaceae bacterium]|nr:hypothetical protein [Candidatus Polarisedimenticolaceae bacterium]
MELGGIALSAVLLATSLIGDWELTEATSPDHCLLTLDASGGWRMQVWEDGQRTQEEGRWKLDGDTLRLRPRIGDVQTYKVRLEGETLVLSEDGDRPDPLPMRFLRRRDP